MSKSDVFLYMIVNLARTGPLDFQTGKWNILWDDSIVPLSMGVPEGDNSRGKSKRRKLNIIFFFFF